MLCLLLNRMHRSSVFVEMVGMFGRDVAALSRAFSWAISMGHEGSRTNEGWKQEYEYHMYYQRCTGLDPSTTSACMKVLECTMKLEGCKCS